MRGKADYSFLAAPEPEVKEAARHNHQYVEHHTYTGPDCATCGRPKSEHTE